MGVDPIGQSADLVTTSAEAPESEDTSEKVLDSLGGSTADRVTKAAKDSRAARDATGGTSTLEMGHVEGEVSENVSVDDVITFDYGYTAAYTNKDLEGFLAERGMSQLIPELIGAFEFLAPVTEENVNESGTLTKETQSSAAGELIDLQSQLKQLRYAESLYFLSQQLGLTTVSSGAGIQFDPESAGASFLQPYNDEMKIAGEVIDYFTSFYNSITSVLEAMDVRSNSYKTRSGTASQSASTTITDGINAYISDIVTNKVENSKNLIDYFRDDLQIPADWYDVSCNTALVGQLIVDVVSKLVFPIQGYYFAPEGESIDSLGIKFGKGVLNLVNPDVFEQGFSGEKSSLSRLSSIKGPLGAIDTETGVYTTDFTANMPDILAELNGLESIGRALYMTARDVINYAVFTTDTEIQGLINDVSGEIIDFNSANSVDVEKSLTSLLGVDPFAEANEFYEISNIDPDLNSKSLILSILPKHSTRSEPAGKIASFDFSTYSLPPEGRYHLDTGKSYFVDDILTNDIDSVKEKIDSLLNNLTSLNSTLALFSKRLMTPASTSISISTPGVVEGRLSAASMTSYFIDTFSKTLDGLYSTDDSSTKNEEILMLLAGIAPHDSSLSAYIIEYILVKEADSRGDIAGANHIEEIASAIADTFITNHLEPAKDNVGDHWELDSLTEGESIEFGSGYKNDLNDSNINNSTITTSAAETRSETNDTFFSEVKEYIVAALTSDSPGVFDAIWKSVKNFEKDINLNMGSAIDENTQTANLEMNSAGRILVVYFVFLEIMKNYLYSAFRVEYHADSSDGLYRVNFGYSMRAVKSVVEASERFLGSSTIDAREDGLDSEEYDTSPYQEWPAAGVGERQNIKDTLLGLSTLYDSQLRYDMEVWNSMHYIDGITTVLTSALETLSSTMAGNNISSDAFNEILSQVSSSEDFGKLAIVALTRDQLMLNRALYDSLSTQNREYPYLPATKAVMSNQMKNLATISTMNELVQTDTAGKRRILTVGLPSGFVERMRNESIDTTGDLNYRKSNLVEISVWRRNLLDETEVADPKKFVFDLSKFIIEGRATDTASGSESIDAAASYAEGQSVEDLYSNITVNSYSPDGQASSFTGKGYALFDVENSETDLTAVFNNHVLDFYLKLYMMLTTGIDVYEDIFPFLEDEVLFNAPDENLKSTFETMKAQLSEMFPSKDATSQLNFERLVGELSRSILLSPKKWRNRIVYPKIFDRTFCILIDETDWTVTNVISDSSDTSDTTATDLIAGQLTLNEFGDSIYESSNTKNSLSTKSDTSDRPTYYQFYITVSLRPHYEEATTSTRSSELESSVSISDDLEEVLRDTTDFGKLTI